jgi:hypothetical protein
VATDRHDYPLSTRSAAACDACVEGADALLGAMPVPKEQLLRALDADPDFALAWIALARSRFLEADVAGAREAAVRARASAETTTPRERSHVYAIALAIEGKPVDVLAATRAHLAEHPRDAMVLAPATGVFGLIGFSGRAQREDELHEWLASLAGHFGDDWSFESVYAFAECEVGRLESAHRRIERSLTACARNAHGAHVLAHVLYELGDPAAASQFLAGWLPGYERAGLMHCHLSWHAALSALQLGRPDQAWDCYRKGVHPGGSWGPPLNTVTDAPSFLWRAELAGQALAEDLWPQVHAYALRSFPKVGVTFADVHIAIACAAVDDQASLQRLIGALQDRLAAGRLPAGDAVPLLAQGFALFARGQWNDSIARLASARGQTVRIGGSRAQRDIVDHTLVAAYLEAGRGDDARRLIAERIDRHPVVQVAGIVAS